MKERANILRLIGRLDEAVGEDVKAHQTEEAEGVKAFVEERTKVIQPLADEDQRTSAELREAGKTLKANLFAKAAG